MATPLMIRARMATMEKLMISFTLTSRFRYHCIICRSFLMFFLFSLFKPAQCFTHTLTDTAFFY